ncbi:cytochrome c551 [Pontibacillus sp. HMF3514]|uniref:cytochrome c551 n=1 Tax=Pontibacillus sp. HMF3514 TaxID=2692425 RepID=UPI00131F6474|nr:cytochrome c [Pontibacillus sp. HMF3514]QHE53581.1 c-type cytochrome [Pontibacillus sp. HMF3514]
MKKQLLAVLFGSALVLGACGGGGDNGADDATENGGEDQTEEQTGDNGDTGDGGGETAGGVNASEAKKYFKQSCAGCHGADLSGNNGPNLQTIGSKYGKDEILNIIKNGKGSMPGNMASGKEAETIAAWLATKK